MFPKYSEFHKKLRMLYSWNKVLPFEVKISNLKFLLLLMCVFSEDDFAINAKAVECQVYMSNFLNENTVFCQLAVLK